MYIHQITLKNIRGFQSLDFNLQRPDKSYAGWTVFTGDNGSGKSTLLKAIAMAVVGPDTTRPLQPRLDRWVNAASEARNGTIHVKIVPGEDDKYLDGPGPPPVKAFAAELELVEGSRETVLHTLSKGSRKSLPERTVWSANKTGWFSCGYGPFRRVFGATAEATEIMSTRSTAPYATMFQEAASLSPADKWLRELDHRASKNQGSAEQVLLDFLFQFLNEDLMPNGMRIQRVDADGLWLADRKGVELSWSEMSDGYRAALALLTDILRHLIQAHDHDGKGLSSLIGTDSEGRLFVKSSGVVLIDEIDAHFHPEWQREIGSWLKSHFPKIQFLVTSHSPMICQAASENGLFRLPEPGSDELPFPLSTADYEKVISSRPDTILLTPAFGLTNTRSPEAVSARAEYSDLAAVRRSGGTLTRPEQSRMKQLELFVNNSEEP